MKWTLGLLFVASVATAMPRNEKAFSLFSVVTFPNEECTTDMMPPMSGQCVTAEECTNSGGTAQGNCASAFGVCCFRSVEATAATQTVPVEHDFTHIQNQGFPMTVGAGAAPVTATNLMFPIRSDASICSIRLDFVNAVFSQPTTANSGTEGICRGAGTTTGDALTIATNPVRRVGFNQLCGTLTGQHLYIDTAMANPALTLNIVTGTNSFGRTWKILVRRLMCSDPNLPPKGANCQQFHTGVTDQITSLNGGFQNQIMLRNLDYRICIRPVAGASGFTVREAGDAAPLDSFGLQTAATTLGANSATGWDAANNNLFCQIERIEIPNAFEANAELLVGAPANAFPPQFCGGVLNPRHDQAAAGIVTALSGFAQGDFIRVLSDNTASSTTTPSGFKLIYQQF